MIEDLLTGDEVLKDFLWEADGLLKDLDRDLAAWQTRWDRPEILRRITYALRAIHRASDLLGLAPLAELTQITEASLTNLGSGQCYPALLGSDKIFEPVGRIKTLVGRLRTDRLAGQECVGTGRPAEV